MSDSKKDGCGGGEHRRKRNRVYWSRRYAHSIAACGSDGKRLTHRAERRQAREIEREALNEVRSREAA